MAVINAKEGKMTIKVGDGKEYEFNTSGHWSGNWTYLYGDFIQEPQKKDVLPDSGTRETYDSGAQRDNQIGKGRYDLISPYALKDLAVRLELGALKYSERNWEKGMPASRYANAIMRHLMQIIQGDDMEDHVGAVLFNAMALSHNRAMCRLGIYDKSLWDLPEYEANNGD